MPKVLLIEDDEDLARSVQKFLIGQNYSVDHAATIEEGDYLARNYPYEVIVLDWELPDGSGAELCARWRAAAKAFPVLMLTGRTAVPDRITGLDNGADDYLCKPFEQDELAARLRSLLKRQISSGDELISFADISINPGARIVTVAGADVKLQPRDFDVLLFMVRSPEIYFSTEHILRKVWNSSSEETQPTAVFSVIKRLRAKLSDTGSTAIVEHKANEGYRLSTKM